MDTLLGTLRHTRDELLERSSKLAGVTRDRSLDALGKVRNGALDWRRTLAARRAELERSDARWLALAGLQTRVLDAADRVLVQLSGRVRAEMRRLRKLELPQPRESESESQRESQSQSESQQREAARELPAARRRLAPAVRAKVLGGAEGRAKPRKNGRSKADAPKAGPKRLVLPIADYETLSAKSIVAELPRLSAAQCRSLLEFERANKKRKSVIAAVESRLAS